MPEEIQVMTDLRVQPCCDDCGCKVTFHAIARFEADTFMVVAGVLDVWVPQWVKGNRPWGLWIVRHG